MKTICSFILLVLFTFSVTAQKKVDLSYHLELNKVYRVKSISVQNTDQTVMGNTQSIQTNNTAVMSLKPLKETEGELIAEVRFDTIVTVISQPPMEINSARPGDMNATDPAKIMECIIHRMANSTFLVKMTNTGRVVQFMNLEPVTAGILQGVDSLQGPTAAFIRQRALIMLEEKSLKSMVESVTACLPGQEVSTGDTWEISLGISGGGMDMTQDGTYKLVDLEKKSAVISGEMVIESTPGTMEMNGAQITPDIRGLGKTELTIDTKTGWVISGTLKQQLKGEMSVIAQGNAMTIPIEINTDLEIVALP